MDPVQGHGRGRARALARLLKGSTDGRADPRRQPQRRAQRGPKRTGLVRQAARRTRGAVARPDGGRPRDRRRDGRPVPGPCDVAARLGRRRSDECPGHPGRRWLTLGAHGGAGQRSQRAPRARSRRTDTARRPTGVGQAARSAVGRGDPRDRRPSLPKTPTQSLC